jgi:hypothetical protein
LMDSELTSITSVKALNQGVATTDSPTFAGLNASGNLTLDVAGNIILDADGGEIEFKDGGTTFGNIAKSSNDMRINQGIQDGDIVFRGNDGGSIITALTLDMSEAGAATFNDNVYVGGDLFVPNLIYHTGDLDTYMQFHQADGWRVVTAGSERFHIQGDQVVVNHDGHNQDFRVESDGDTHALFINGATNSVNVGSAYGGNSKFTVNQSASEITCYLQNTLSNVGSTTPSIIYLQTPNDSVIADGFKMVTFADQDTVLGSIATAGSSTQIAYNTSSDERLKENIVDAGSQLDTLLAVKVREYDWKKNGFHSTGFIAQELHEHIPEAVTVGLEDPTQHPWSVDYGRLTPFIIKAMQEQQELIKTLEARIAALES